MNHTTMFLTILGMGVITYLLRVIPFLLAGRHTLPPTLIKALRYVPAAVLSAIIVPELFMPQGTLDISLGNARLIAGLIAILVAWRTRNVMLTIVIGMVVLWILQALGTG